MFGQKLKEEYQRTVIITPTGDIDERQLIQQTRLISWPDMFQAWELDSRQQVRDEDSGKMTQFVSSVNKRPLKIYRNRTRAAGRATEVIAAQEFDKKLTSVTEQESRHSMLLWLGIFGVSTLIVLLVSAIIFLRSSHG